MVSRHMISRLGRLWRTIQQRLLANRKTLLYMIGAIVLVVGLETALRLYQTREEASDNDTIYQMHHSKRYRHDLQLMGGEMNLVADDLFVWFEGLWQGKSLAYTVAWMTVIVSGSFFLVAHHLPDDPRSEA